MRKYITAIIVLLFSFLYINMVYAAGDTWTAKTAFGGTARLTPVGFSIGNYGYIGTGYNGSLTLYKRRLVSLQMTLCHLQWQIHLSLQIGLRNVLPESEIA